MTILNNITLSKSHHSIPPNYHEWGLSGKNPRMLETLTAEEQVEIDEHIHSHYAFLQLSELALQYTFKAKLYQGDAFKALDVTFMRYQNYAEVTNGEHLSVLLDANTHQLLGFTQMVDSFANANLPHPEEAMNIAIDFLSKHARDLVKTKEVFQLPSTVEANDHITFNTPIEHDNVTFQWIGQHHETIQINGQDSLISGIKVKMHIPEFGLWAWVIVGHNGEILTFERNIAWDFDKHCRQTQMWLHSHWLTETAKAYARPASA